MRPEELKEFLEEKSRQYNHPNFIESDPILIPHLFSRKEDIEISGFLAATLAWGQRKTIISSARKILKILGNEPYDFIMNASPESFKNTGFVHRTFNDIDLEFFFRSLKNIYQKHGGLENVFAGKKFIPSQNISNFKNIFLQVPHQQRSSKHLSDPAKNSSAKRICMFLRWMVRKDAMGVDFGIWKKISPSDLMLPLDLHTGNTSRKLGILKRNSNDWKAVEEVTSALRLMKPEDPVYYDFALFGLGVFEKF